MCTVLFCFCCSLFAPFLLELPYVSLDEQLFIQWMFVKRAICQSLRGCLWPLQSASVYIHLFNVCSVAAERHWRCQPSSLVFTPTPCDSQRQPESVRRVGGGSKREREAGQEEAL